MISATPIDMDMIVAVVGVCLGTRDRTQMVSTVAGTHPAAKRPATCQSTLPFLEWIAVAAAFVTAAESKTGPPPARGWAPEKSNTHGARREPPPQPRQTNTHARR